MHDRLTLWTPLFMSFQSRLIQLGGYLRSRFCGLNFVRGITGTLGMNARQRVTRMTAHRTCRAVRRRKDWLRLTVRHEVPISVFEWIKP